MGNVWLNRIATALPPFEGHSKFLEYAPSMLADERERRMFARLAEKAQIDQRYTIFEPSPDPERLDVGNFYSRGDFPLTAARMQMFELHAPALATAAAREAISGLRPQDITHLIVTSCTGFSAPGLDLQIQQALELRPSLERTLIGFMGCYAAINGLKAAWHTVRSMPDAKVLLVNLELCTLHLQERVNLEGLLGFMQFADGCAASIISAEPNGLELKRFQCEVMPEAADLITWHVGNHGFNMHLSTSVPKVLGDNLPSLLRWLDEPINLWAVHPGGHAILDAVESGLRLQPEDLRASREVLRKFGNMSSATVMFVLKSMLEGGDAGNGIAMAFGPGLTLESMTFRKP
jgi:predicted naringenin-chalcone synthase